MNANNGPASKVLIIAKDNCRNIFWKNRLGSLPTLHCVDSAEMPDNAPDSMKDIACILATPDAVLNTDIVRVLLLEEDQTSLPQQDPYITPAMPNAYILQTIYQAIRENQLKKQLLLSHSALTEFCHIAAHDLKAPARRIAQFCELLKTESGDGLSVDCLDYIDRMQVNAVRLQNLVGEILSYSQALNPDEEKQLVDMNDVLKKILESLQPAIIQNTATIKSDTLPRINVYPQAISLIFKSLLDNAMKYRSPAAPVIAIHYDEDETHHIFTIRDNGAGIAEKFHASVFKPFQRLQTQDEVEGSGLGLAICQKLVELHGGKIWIDQSQPGTGSVFKFSLAK